MMKIEKCAPLVAAGWIIANVGGIGKETRDLWIYGADAEPGQRVPGFVVSTATSLTSGEVVNALAAETEARLLLPAKPSPDSPYLDRFREFIKARA